MNVATESQNEIQTEVPRAEGTALRLFIALRVPAVVQKRLTAVRSRLEEARLPFRWVRPEGVHLTLVFLGSVAAARVDEIGREMAQAAAAARPLRLEASGLGAFPSLSQPRVLWVGLIGDVDALAGLQRDLDRRMRRLGFELDQRPFRPHVTLGRATGSLDASSRLALQAELKRPGQQFGRWRATSVELIESKLSRGGSVYTTLLEAELGRPA